MIYPWVNAIVRLGEYAAGKLAWIEHLKSRYRSAEDAAIAWGIPVSPAYGITWEYLTRLDTWFHPAARFRAREDLVPFMAMIAERWYRLHHEKTGKPILNGDGSFGYPNPHQQKYSVKGFRTNSTGNAEVVAKYQECLEDSMGKPYMVGWHHCGYLEQWDDSERGDVNSNENGFLDPFENEHTAWTDTIRETNQRTHALHEMSAPPSP